MYQGLRDKGYSASEAVYILNRTPITKPNIVNVKRSFSVAQANVGDGNILDVCFGYSEPDTAEIFGEAKLEPSGWNKVPSNEFTGDINHYNYDMAEGVKNDLPEKWKHFTTKAKDFYTKITDKGTELRGKVFIPETDLGKEFLEDYNKGKYGISIEATGNQQGNVIKDWSMTGYTFHEDPSYKHTKPKEPKTL